MRINNYYTPTLQYKNYKNIVPTQHNAICFGSHRFIDLSKKEIFEKIDNSIVPENFLGQGTEAEVYKIKDTNYCIRIPHIAQGAYKSNFSKKLTQIDKVNHVVAKLGFGASIMKFFDGVVPEDYRNNEYNRHKLQTEIAQMPIKSYTNLLHQIANAINHEMFFDFSGGNLIVDTKKQKLTAIDFFSVSDNPKPVNPLTEIYSILTVYGAEEETGKKIFDKIIDAGLKEFKPNKIPCMDTALFDFTELCIRRKRDRYLPNAEKVISQIMYHTKLLQKIKSKEIIDKSLSSLLEEKIYDMRSILKHIR